MLQDSSASSRFCLPWWLLLPNQAEKRVKFCKQAAQPHAKGHTKQAIDALQRAT
jgi:hypothetical protein